MDTCTIAALDAITAFAVPNPNGLSQSSWFASGLVFRQVASPGGLPSLIRIGQHYLGQSFQPSTIRNLSATGSECRDADHRFCKDL